MPTNVRRSLIEIAYAGVAAAPSNLRGDYAVRAAQLPALLRTHGLAQTAAFLAHKARATETTADGQLLRDLGRAVGLDLAAGQHLQVGAGRYRLAAQQARMAAAYFKRFAETGAGGQADPAPPLAVAPGPHRPGVRRARDSTNAGQVLAYGLAGHAEDGGDKRGLIDRLCKLPPGTGPAADAYSAAFARWKALPAGQGLVRECWQGTASRLFLGNGEKGVLEANVLLHRTYGTPLIPGSAQKGLARAYAAAATAPAGLDEALLREVFGAAVDDDEDAAGIVRFHDAWLVPGGSSPFRPEVVTPHHPAYYGSEGATPATDLDDPIPAPQIAVHGAFLFVVEGPPGAAPFAAELLRRALRQWGIGARITSGYGLVEPRQG